MALSAAAVLAVVASFLADIDGGFANSDEVLYAEFIRTMHRTGDWITIRYGGAPVLQRPWAPIALYAAVSAVVDGELGLRLTPTLFTAITTIAVGALVWRKLGSLAAGVATMLLLAATPSVHVYGRMLLSDPPFVLAATAALVATIAAQDRPSMFKWAAAALGLAFATKSFAAAVPTLGLAPWLIVAWRRHRRAIELKPRLAASMFLSVAAPFYIIGLAQHGHRFLAEHFGYNLAARAAGDLEGIGVGGPTAYFVHIVRADGPIVAVLYFGGILGAAVYAWRKRNVALAVAATYASAVFLGLSVISTRLPHYLLVFYPAAAICLGATLALMRLRTGVQLLVPIAALALLVHTSGQPPFDETAYPSPETESFAAIARAATNPNEPVYSLDWYAPALGYYADRRWVMLSTHERATRIVGSIDLFRAAGTVKAVPPWPSGHVVVAGPKQSLDRGPLRHAPVLSRNGELELREAMLPDWEPNE